MLFMVERELGKRIYDIGLQVEVDRGSGAGAD